MSAVRFADSHTVVYQGDAREVLRGLPPESVQCVVTSPPYWGLRDYGLPPLVWGGDMAGCPHEWGDERLRRVSSISENTGLHNDGRAVQVTEKYRETLDAMTPPTAQGAVCRLCGAWRGTLGLEPTPELYVAHIVEVMREVRRVLRKDGTVWLNMGDSYAARWPAPNTRRNIIGNPMTGGKRGPHRPERMGGDLKDKDLVGVPWAVAFALRADGWWLRSDIVWSKPNPMPESVTDRPTRAHEYVFLLSKSARYYYDADAIREPQSENTHSRGVNGIPALTAKMGPQGEVRNNASFQAAMHDLDPTVGRNKRTVWEIATQPYPEAHFATFPEALVMPCILAGTSERGCCADCGAPWARVMERKRVRDHTTTAPSQAGSPYAQQETTGGTDIRHGLSVAVQTTGWRPSCKHEAPTQPCVVLDPFGGSGTVAVAARKAGRRAILIDLSGEYCELAIERIRQGVLV